MSYRAEIQHGDEVSPCPKVLANIRAGHINSMGRDLKAGYRGHNNPNGAFPRKLHNIKWVMRLGTEHASAAAPARSFALVDAERGDGGAVDRLDDANALPVGGCPNEEAIHFRHNFLDEYLKVKSNYRKFGLTMLAEKLEASRVGGPSRETGALRSVLPGQFGITEHLGGMADDFIRNPMVGLGHDHRFFFLQGGLIRELLSS